MNILDICTHAKMHFYVRAYILVDTHCHIMQIHRCAHVCLCVPTDMCMNMFVFVCMCLGACVRVFAYAHSVCVYFLEEEGNRTVSRFPKYFNPSLRVCFICEQQMVYQHVQKTENVEKVKAFGERVRMHVSSMSSKISNKKSYALTHTHTYVPRMDEFFQFFKNLFAPNITI